MSPPISSCSASTTARPPSSSTSPRSGCCSIGWSSRQVIETNPAAAVRGPKHVVKRGKTPVLEADEARQLLGSIDVSTPVGLRDRALIGLLIYTFARVSAAIGMNVEDYYVQGRRSWVRLHEKGGKQHDMPAHHLLESYVDGRGARLLPGLLGGRHPTTTSGRGGLSWVDGCRVVVSENALSGLGIRPSRQ